MPLARIFCRACNQKNFVKHRRTSQRAVAFLSVPLLAGILFAPRNILAQGRDGGTTVSPDVIIDLGKPNVWTMDQAHYLLERNRVRDLGLQTADLTNLDPNDINGIRLDSLRSLISAQVQFDAAAGANNRNAFTQYQQRMQQYQGLYAQREAIRLRQSRLATDLASAQGALTILQAQVPADTAKIASENAAIASLTSQKAEADAEYTQLTTQMGAQPSVPTFTSTTPGDATSQTVLNDDANFNALLKLYATGVNATKQAASIRLDNYINMQYELVSKQLTLLRDDAGPDNEVLFIELPQSVYVTNKLRLYPYLGGWWGAHLVQSWWRLDEALLAQPPGDAPDSEDLRPPTKRELLFMNNRFPLFSKVGATSDCSGNYLALQSFFTPGSPCAAIYKTVSDQLPSPGKYLLTKPTTSQETKQQEQEVAIRANAMSLFTAEARQKTPKLDVETALTLNALASTSISLSAKERQELVAAAKLPGSKLNADGTCAWADKSENQRLCKWVNNWNFSLLLSPLDSVRPNTFDRLNRVPLGAAAELSSPAAPEPMYALDLIPRQSTLNVADANVASHNYGFAGLFSLLSGIGGKARYERQHNQFNQFVQQETYASAFGKGSYEFGWTFGPLPGTNRMAPGLRTTYAIVVVPKATRFVRMYGIGCAYRRRNVPFNPYAKNDLEQDDKSLWQHGMNGEECGSQSTFDIEVPSSEDTFYVEHLRYRPVAQGQRQTLEIEGRFGEQVGILVNGTPLQKVASIGQPNLVTANYVVPTNAGESGVQGVFELVHGHQLIVSFVVPPTFAGTPQITLVTAGREAVLNNFKVWPDRVKPNEVSDKTDSDAPAMFTQPPAIARVESSPGASADVVQVKIVGKGFAHPDTDSLVFGTDTLTLLPAGNPPAKGFYQTDKSNSVIAAWVDRKKYFPHTSIDYISVQGQQTTDATASYDDDLLPVVDAGGCKFTKTSKDGTDTASVTVTGKYFTDLYTPATKDKDLIISAATRTADTQWKFTVTSKSLADHPALSLQSSKQSLPLDCSADTKVQPKAPAGKAGKGAASGTAAGAHK